MKFREIEAEQTRIVVSLAKECSDITNYEFTTQWSTLKNCYLNYNNKMIFIVVFSGVTYRIFDDKGTEVHHDHLELTLIEKLLK